VALRGCLLCAAAAHAAWRRRYYAGVKSDEQADERTSRGQGGRDRRANRWANQRTGEQALLNSMTVENNWYVVRENLMGVGNKT